MCPNCSYSRWRGLKKKAKGDPKFIMLVIKEILVKWYVFTINPERRMGKEKNIISINQVCDSPDSFYH